ncbi:MAG: hypothetical protein QXK24_06730 [Ignisphaera sp.]
MIDVKKLEEELKKISVQMEKQLNEAIEKFKKDMEELAKSTSKTKK